MPRIKRIFPLSMDAEARVTIPEKRLLGACLARAIVDVLDSPRTWQVRRVDRLGAEAWVFGEVIIEPWSFTWVVESLGLSPRRLRKLIIEARKDKALAARLLQNLLRTKPFHQCLLSSHRYPKVRAKAVRRKKGEEGEGILTILN